MNKGMRHNVLAGPGAWFALVMGVGLLLPATRAQGQVIDGHEARARQDVPATRIERDPQSGKITRVLDERGDFRYGYDAKGRLISAARVGDTSIEMAYAEQDQVECMRLIAADGRVIDTLLHTYAEDGQLSRLELVGKRKVEIRRDANGEVIGTRPRLRSVENLIVFGMHGRLKMLKLPMLLAEQAQRGD